MRLSNACVLAGKVCQSSLSNFASNMFCHCDDKCLYKCLYKKTSSSKFLLSATLFSVTLLLQSCVATTPVPAEEILGAWESNLGGFTIRTDYTMSDVRVDDHPAVMYTMTGDELILGDDAITIRIVRFPSETEMIQKDPITGTERTYQRTSD